MSHPIFLTTATAALIAVTSLAAATSAEAHRHRHRHGGVAVVIGAPIVFGGYGYHQPRYDYAPYYYRSYKPVCRRWGWVHSRSGKVKRRCIAW